MRDWIVAHIFRHKCPAGKAAYIPPIRFNDKIRVRVFDPKGDVELLGTPGKSSAWDSFEMLQAAWGEQERVSLAIHTFADQLEKWASQNDRKHDAEHNAAARTLYGWMAAEQRNYATTLRQILRTDREAELDAMEAESERD